MTLISFRKFYCSDKLFCELTGDVYIEFTQKRVIRQHILFPSNVFKIA